MPSAVTPSTAARRGDEAVGLHITFSTFSTFSPLLHEQRQRNDCYDDNAIDGLVEFLLRIIQSMVIAPSEPPRTGTEMRAYLRRWIGPAIAA